MSSTDLRDVFRQWIDLSPHAIVATYRAFGDELDPSVLTEELEHNGHPIALPIVTGKGKPLAFRLYKFGDALHANALGILQPDAAAPVAEPDVLLIPLLAFDHLKNRLGYGGGFYDRTLFELRERKRIMAIGIAYHCQRVERVPTHSHDAPLDKIVTEVNVF